MDICYALHIMDANALRVKYKTLADRLGERAFRLCLASDALALGRGGISQVAEAAGVSRTTIYVGVRELSAPATSTSLDGGLDKDQRAVRRPGGGLQLPAETDRTRLAGLSRLVDPHTRCAP